MSPIARGNLSPRIVEGTTITLSVDGDSGTVIKRGTYASLLAGRPAKSSLYEHEGITFRVTSTTLRRDKGALGTLTINLYDRSKSGSGNPNILENPNETVELDFSLIEKPLEGHPRYWFIFNNQETSVPLEMLKKWESIPDEYAERKVQMFYPTSGLTKPITWAALPEGVAEFCKKKLFGIESYYLQVPVVRKTSILLSAPASSSAGQRDTPPDFAACAEAWLKTADACIRRGKRGAWERREEWSGFDFLDPQLYP